MLSLEDYRSIELEDKPIFDKHYEKYPPTHSDNLFTTLISWRDYTEFFYNILDECLIIFGKRKNGICLRPPHGKRKKEIFDHVIKLTKEIDSNYSLSLIDVDTKEWMANNYKGAEFLPQREFFDYVYLSSDLAELSGSKYSKIRNRLNKFKKNFKYSVEKINEDNISDVKEFLKRWCLWKDCRSNQLLEAERKAILFSMNHFFELNLSGIAILINDKIEAISVFEKMDNDTVVVHYEKGSPDYDGIYKAINQETASLVRKDFKYIDRGSDLGIQGLRRAKLSYNPHHMIEVYALNKNSIQ